MSFIDERSQSQIPSAIGCITPAQLPRRTNATALLRIPRRLLKESVWTKVIVGEQRESALLTCNPFKLWSGRRGLNPQPTAWEAATLPLSYSRSVPGASSGSEYYPEIPRRHASKCALASSPCQYHAPWVVIRTNPEHNGERQRPRKIPTGSSSGNPSDVSKDVATCFGSPRARIARPPAPTQLLVHERETMRSISRIATASTAYATKPMR